MIFILFFICITFGGTFAGQETDFPVITLNITRGINDFVCDNVYTPKLIWGSPFNIKVFTEVFIDDANCNDDNGNYNFKYKFKKENEYYISAHTILAKKHISMLKCDFFISHCKNYSTKCSRDEPKTYTVVGCTFPENIRYPELAYMTANLNRLNTSIAFGHESYDVIGKHKFFEGELVKFSCFKTSKKNNLINVFSFSTTNVKENRTFITDTIKDFNTSIYIKLTTAYDGGYIDCFVTSYDQVQKLTIRIQLELNMEPMSGRLGFKVNGVVLSAEMEDVYTYAYVDGETLAVQSIKDPNMHGKMSCLGENFPANFEDYKTPQEVENVNLTTILRESDGNVTLNCLVSCIHPYKDKQINLKLVKQIYTYSNYPYINGLFMSKITETYKNDDVTVIGYDYDDELLNLKCYSDKKGAEWHYNETEVTQTKNEFNENILGTNDYYAYGEFKLKNNISYSTISCIYKGKKIKIVLNGKNKYITPEITQNYDTSPKPEDNTTVVPEGSTGVGKLPLTLKIFIIGACFTIIVIIIVLILIITCIKRKKHKEALNANTTDILYENLPKHNEQENKSTLQLCNNEEVYAAPVDNLDQSIYAQPYTPQTVEEMYSAVVPKNQRANLDSPYTNTGNSNPNSKTAPNKVKHGLNYVKVFPQELNRTSSKQKLLKNSKKVIDDNTPYAEVTMNESPYAEVISNESPYAEVTSNDSPYAEVVANESPYAEVINKKKQQHANVINNESPYAEVTATESAYAEPFNNIDNKYTNVFDNERYVNAQAKNDYAETAYCELKSSEVKK